MSLKLGNTDIAGTQILYSTTGNNTDGAMTQNATTTQLNLKANDANVVHKTGNETIGGTKTFNTNYTAFKGTNIDVLNSPAVFATVGINYEDVSNVVYGQDFIRTETNGSLVNTKAIKSHNGDNWANLVIGFDANDNVFTHAPASDAFGSIVTTTGIHKAENGYVKLGNGLIVQWGKTPNIGNSGTTCTLPTPFTTTNYSVTAITSATFNENSIGLIGKTTTTFTLVEKGYGGGAHNVPNYFLAIGY